MTPKLIMGLIFVSLGVISIALRRPLQKIWLAYVRRTPRELGIREGWEDLAQNEGWMIRYYVVIGVVFLLIGSLFIVFSQD
jgi:hypothetical protein